jgi:hypothetical protein
MFVLDEDTAERMEAMQPGMNAAMIDHYLKVVSGPGVESGNRLEVLLALTKYQASGVFWPVFHETWPMCDGTWENRGWLERVLMHHHLRRRGTDYLPANDRAWFDSLPDPIRVYRGCSRQRERAVSRTTDEAVALKFARGTRWRNPHPVVVTGMVSKCEVVGVYTDRKESEVVTCARGSVDWEYHPIPA